ncbi:MAG: ATPase, T2SS/T4P/T4SS family [Planctomycetota bacterium]
MIDVSAPVTLAEALVLVSWWKAILILPPIVGWAWLVSTVFDKQADRFSLGRDGWNAVHLALGLVALIAALAIPIPAWWSLLIGYALMLAILGADIAAFVVMTNGDERVPEGAKLKLDLSALKGDAEAKKAAKQQAKVSIKIVGPGKQVVPPPQKETPEYEVRALAEERIIEALDNRGSRLDIVASQREGASGVSYIVDGVRQGATQLAPQQAVAMIDFWKACAGLDVKDRRRKQTATFKIERSDVPTELKLTTSGAQGGVQLTLVVDPSEAVKMKAGSIGLLPQQIELLEQLLEARGVMLLTAPKQQGRTTTMYAMLGMHDAYTQNIVTLEHEIESEIEGVRQSAFDPTAEAEFSTTLRSMIRRDPDVVGVGDVPDAETAKEAAAVEADRTRIYLSMTAEGSLPALATWTKAVGDADAAGKPLTGIVTQRLVRRLCENCRIEYQPPPEMLKKLQLPADRVKRLFKKGGQVLIKNKPETCPVCQGTGYFGQTGIFEVLPFGPEERAALRDQNWNGLKAEWRKKGAIMLNQAALRLAAEGVTSVEEITRVTAPPQQKKPKPKPPQGDGNAA